MRCNQPPYKSESGVDMHKSDFTIFCPNENKCRDIIKQLSYYEQKWIKDTYLLDSLHNVSASPL